MVDRLPIGIRVHGSSIWRLIVAACMLVLVLAACKPETPADLTVVDSTPPARTASAPTVTVAVPAPTVFSDAVLPAPTDASPRESALAVPPPPTVPPDVLASTSARAEELTGRLLRLRRFDANSLWAGFVMTRTLGVGGPWAPDLEAPAKLLQMWHPGNECYAMLEAEIARLGPDRRVRPEEIGPYFDHFAGRLSPCLDEQLAEVDAQRLFENSEAVRTDRVRVWFDSIWAYNNEVALTSIDHCWEGFYSHLPSAALAADALGLEASWSGAMLEFGTCQEQAMRDGLPFLELGDTQMFAFELNDRYTLITLQASFIGHMLAINKGRPYEECWLHYEAKIPQIAVATSPSQFVDSRDTAIRALLRCIEQLPAADPFGRQ